MPIAQPPGSETLALPNLASKGPSTKIPARIVLTNLYEANFFLCFLLSIINFFLSNFIFDPNDFNKLIIVSISLTLGKFFKIILPSESNVAAKMGNDAFFEPEISTCPLSLFAPKTSNFCMIILLVKLHLFVPYTYHFYQHK